MKSTTIAHLIASLSLVALIALAGLAVAQERGLPPPAPFGEYAYPRSCQLAYVLKPGQRRVYTCPLGSTAELLQIVAVRSRHDAVDTSVIDVDQQGARIAFTNRGSTPVFATAVVEVW